MIGPAWSMNIKGPTILRRRKGRMRFTFIDLLIAASRASMTSSTIDLNYVTKLGDEILPFCVDSAICLDSARNIRLAVDLGACTGLNSA